MRGARTSFVCCAGDQKPKEGDKDKVSAPAVIHIPHDLVDLDQAVRGAITSVTGLAVEGPTTVTTGCAKRRKVEYTSRLPEAITCAQCRVYAAVEYARWAAAMQRAATLPDAPADKIETWHGHAELYLYLAAQFAAHV